MQARIQGVGGWYDPHNNGTYSLLSTGPTEIKGQRLTGKPPHYKDLFTFTFTASGHGCAITACSESQVHLPCTMRQPPGTRFEAPSTR